ncbi:aspartoacylase [Agaribacter flavus]|uniref:Aspartoacylase n=1 Tax=Agaribacter flavus TaxID=1902781 RepID=A0ABV7FLE8_9ALTE
MMRNDVIKSVLVSGGTHGNELSGVYAVEYWQQNSDELLASSPSIHVDFTLVNEKAIKNRTRYVEEDLNRQFSHVALNTNANKRDKELNYEQQLAQSLNARYGPKSNPQYDLVIDIHNTTSNMGPSVILLALDEFHICLARFIKNRMPEAVILVEDQIPFETHPYFCTLGKKGLMLELGAQAHSTLKASLFEQTKQLTHTIFAFIQSWNEQSVAALPVVEAFKLIEEIKYPQNNGKKSAMIHPAIDGKDFLPLHKGDPCFLDFDGKTITWDEDTVYPHFIGEAAYHHLDIAFATASKITI